ncbi:MAG: Fur family transcriptional regulator [Deltaproteobacteria bacterium]|jgi:Fur family ferric uptake transcriptional regulator|nr:Fur family transcriptional regulator [Deltaproteobacteria bacterium]
MEKLSEFSFRQLLKERGLKSTHQRDVIVQLFIEAGDHWSVDELYQRVRQRNPKIGHATVYRTLRLMAESGWASSRQFGDRIARFEHQAEGQHHDHLICLGCGKIVEFESERIEALQSRIAHKKGFQIFEHKLELYGQCPDCLSKKEGTGKKTRKKAEHG